MTTALDIRIVDATREHAPFIAWTVMAANRSHLPLGMWDLIVGGSEAEVVGYLGKLSVTEQTHWASYPLFKVAEVDGQPAAALCGFFENELPAMTLMSGAMEVNAQTGLAPDRFAEGWERAKSIMNLDLKRTQGAWVVEHVATHPDFRRRGLVERLMYEMLDRGRERGATVGSIGVFIENDAAQRAYEKCGFKVIGETRNAEFEAAYGSPGARILEQPL